MRVNAFPKGKALVALAAIGFASQALAQQLSNPGFEQDLTDWSQTFDYGMSLALPEAARTGNAGLRITDDKPDKGSGLESLPVEVEAGKKYEVSFWLKTVSGEGGVQVALRFFDEAGKSLQKKFPSVTAGPSVEWKPYSVKAAAPERAVGVTIVIRSLPAGTTTADLDDFEFREIPAP
jgi:hypothetical protein